MGKYYLTILTKIKGKGIKQRYKTQNIYKTHTNTKINQRMNKNEDLNLAVFLLIPLGKEVGNAECH